MQKILETERLLLRELTPADFPSLALILQDEQTMYAYEGAFNDHEVHIWLDNQLARYAEDGFGLWAVILKENGCLIGQCGLTWQQANEHRVLEVGYLFNRNYWKHGYAIEAASACKQYAFDKLNAPAVYSIIRDNNFPSMNVAIRNGMLVRGQIVKYYRGVTMPHLVLRADNVTSSQ